MENKLNELREFVELIARMTTTDEFETRGEYRIDEDADLTLDDLIATARQLLDK